MADNTVLNTGTGGDTIASDDIGGIKHQRVKVEHGADGSATDVSTSSPLPVDQTNTSVADGGTLPAKGVQVGGTDGTVFQVFSTDSAGRVNTNVTGTVPVSGPVTDTQLRASAVPVSSASLPLPSGASTSAKQPALGTAGTASADVISVQGVASMTPVKVDGSGVTQPVSGTVTASGPLTDVQLRATAVPVSGTVTANAGTGPFPVSDNAGSLTVDAPVGTPVFVRLSDGTSAIATLPVSLASLPALATGSNLAGRVNVEPQTANGLSIFHLVSAATTNATNVKASAGQLYGWFVYNSNAAARKLVFHNTAGTPTAGASVVFSIVIPPSSGANVEYTNGLAFATGIAITTVTGLADSDTAAVAANDLVINLFYK